jgi:NTP pyrophosphatase (non-canonical NTP hydrolase)
MPTAQEIKATQGTRLSEESPWDSYANELTGPNMTPELAAEVAEYALKRYADAPVSSQTQEVLAESREINEEIAKQYNWLDYKDYANQEERIGKVLHSSVFITKLRQCGVNCFYRQHPHPDKATLLVSVNGGELQVAAWVQLGNMPELSMFNFDAYGTPLAEKRRGWRTVTLQLILKGLLKEDVADKVFGKPGDSPAFNRYKMTLYGWRQRDKGWDNA